MEKAKKNRLVIILAGILAIVLLAFGTVEYTSQTGFCNTCHEMKKSYTGWQNSSHQDLHCYKCHTDEGLAAKVKVKVNGLKEVYIHLTEEVNMDQVNSIIPEQRCLKCHDFGPKGKYGERIIAFHEQHQDLKFNCLTCHSTTGHSADNFTGFKNEACKQCHQPKK